MPKPEKYSEAIKTLPYSSGLPSAMDRPQFATSVTPGKVESVPKQLGRKDYPHPENPKSEKMGTGDSNQPFLKPSLTKKQLEEKFPGEKAWNPRGRQFLNIVGASDATKELQSKADTNNYPKGREALPSDPAKSVKSHK